MLQDRKPVEAELLFEDPFQTGKTVHLHFVDLRLSPF